MSRGSQTTTQVLGGQDIPMHPSDIHPSTSKRKASGEDDPMNGNVAKKLKQEHSTKTGTAAKRKLIGEEQPGGLFIVRASSTRPHPPQEPSSNDHSRTASGQSAVPLSSQVKSNGTNHVPPAKKYKADVQPSGPTRGKGKEREDGGRVTAEPDVEEDVRKMQSETDTLRRKSRAAGSTNGTNPDFQFPVPSTNGRTPSTPSRSVRPTRLESRGRSITRETSQLVAEQETPRIERNKTMRAEPGSTRRKSSLTRGKRITMSYANSGVITQPHTAVRDSNLYKHVDIEQPEPQRARQLLIWCSRRAMDELAEEQSQVSAARQGSSNSGKDLPPVSADDVKLLKGVEDEIIRMLAEGKLDTNVFSSPEDPGGPEQLKENEQNVRNKAREVRFNAHIQKLKQEDEAWVEVGTSYNSFRAAVLEELEERKREFPSAKAKGKRKATAEDVAAWSIPERDLPAHFRGKDGLGLARALVETDAWKGPLHERMVALEATADRLHSLAHSALESTYLAEIDLDRRFAALNLSLATRAQPSLLTSSNSVLSSFLPPSRTRPPPAASPQDLLRAMSRFDAARPQNQVGDAARRAAREAQRAGDAPAPERRLTGVPPPTPRKPPGTPRRPTTPARPR